jgi:DNA-binding XRE family transcriptional regulator
MNKKLLRSVMALHGDTNATLAAFLGISEQSVSNKINENGTEFKQGEIAKIKERYKLDSAMIDRIFFAG